MGITDSDISSLGRFHFNPFLCVRVSHVRVGMQEREYEQEIIDAVKNAIENTNMNDAEPLKNQLELYNNLGGGINAHGNPI